MDKGLPRKKILGMPGKKKLFYICSPIADVAKLVDALDLGSSVERRGGSSPFIRTDLLNFNRFFHARSFWFHFLDNY